MMSLAFEAKVEGAGADVLNFLTRLQSDHLFYAIPSITVAADRKDSTTLKVDLIFCRWFVEDDGALMLDEIEETPAAVAKKAEEQPAESEPN